MAADREPTAADGREVKLPCGCYAAHDKDGYLWVTDDGFFCEARHKQGDLVEVREGKAK